MAKMRRLLTPLEYTRLDQLVDVVFTTTQDVETAVSAETGKSLESENQEQSESSESVWEFTPNAVIQGIRDRIVAALGHQLECSFVKKSRALYWDPPQRQRVVCTVSKRYTDQNLIKYWYAYHPKWHSFLQEGEHGFFVLGCTDLDMAFTLPVAVISDHLEEFYTSPEKNGKGHYYHIQIIDAGAEKYALQLPRSGRTLVLDPYLIQLGHGQDLTRRETANAASRLLPSS